jgi:hypothetical protein
VSHTVTDEQEPWVFTQHPRGWLRRKKHDAAKKIEEIKARWK